MFAAGGATIGAGNTIAFNGGAGILAGFFSGLGNTFSANAIFSNAALGMDLSANGALPNGVGDGVTKNDLGDPDTGPNNLQNFPVITSATSGVNPMIQGTLNSIANATTRWIGCAGEMTRICAGSVPWPRVNRIIPSRAETAGSTPDGAP